MSSFKQRKRKQQRKDDRLSRKQQLIGKRAGGAAARDDDDDDLDALSDLSAGSDDSDELQYDENGFVINTDDLSDSDESVMDGADGDTGDDSEDDEEAQSDADEKAQASARRDDKKETEDERRVRIAKEYLDKIKKIEDESKEADEAHNLHREDEDPIARRLREAAKQAQRAAPRTMSGVIEQTPAYSSTAGNVQFYRGHHKAVTCLALDSERQIVYSGSKDCCILRWDLRTGRKTVWKGLRNGADKLGPQGGHTQEILTIAVSTDGKYVVSGGRDRAIRVWDATKENGVILESIEDAHQGPITALSFQHGTHQFYSGSTDRVVKVWDAAQQAFVEALYGHEADVMAMDSLHEEKALSCGVDCSIRLWKIQEETQMIHKGHAYSIDCVRMLNETAYVSGSQDGSIALWLSSKRKPIAYFQKAHAGEWISAVGALRFSDVVASGSSDGYLKFYRADIRKHELVLINQVALQGFVNSIEFSADGSYAVVGLGQEHRFGRWRVDKKAKNGIAVIRLVGEAGAAALKANFVNVGKATGKKRERATLDEEDDDEEAGSDSEEEEAQAPKATKQKAKPQQQKKKQKQGKEEDDFFL